MMDIVLAWIIAFVVCEVAGSVLLRNWPFGELAPLMLIVPSGCVATIVMAIFWAGRITQTSP
jgi:hypothetical protein